MRRTILCLLALLLLLSCAGVAEEALADDASTMMVVNCTDWVSLRAQDDATSSRLAQVPLGATVTNCMPAANAFVCCEYAGQTGYILSQYLTPCYTINGNTILFSKESGADSETITAVCRDAGGAELWRTEAGNTLLTELDGVSGFIAGDAARPLVMLYSASAGLSALDAATGETLWTLASDTVDLGGSISYVVGADGTMYIGGYYGPDPVAISLDGSVLWQADVNDANVYWMYELELRADGVAAHYECTDGMGGTPAWALFDFEGNLVSRTPDAQ